MSRKVIINNILRIRRRAYSLRRYKIRSLRELNSKIITLITSIRSRLRRFNTIIISSIDIISIRLNTRTILRVIKYVIKTLIREKRKFNTYR